MTFIPPDPHSPDERSGEAANDPQLLTRRDRSSERLPAPPRQKPASAPPPSRVRSRHLRMGLRRILITCCVLASIAVPGTFGAALWLRHAMRAALPQLDGSIHLAGLHGSVTVTRDAVGVPSIHAQTLDDALFAQGYVTAQDRLFQMDALRRHAAGELAEILGPSLVEHDKLQRYLQMRSAAERGLAALPPEQVHLLESYAQGVSAFIETHRDSLPVEFHLLHYQPAEWTPLDSLLVTLAMWQDLSTEYPQKLHREALSAHLPSELLPDLYPVGSWRDHPPTQPTTNLTTPRQIEEIPLDETQYSRNRPSQPTASPQDLLRYGTETCDGCLAGSNNWAVSGARSASGMPLLSNDMHLGLNAPDIWYEASLHTSDAAALDVTGFTLPGAPFVVVGRNAHVAWSVTSLGGDVQDIHIEHLRGSGTSTEFERPDGSWSPVAHHAEFIHVRGGRNLSLDVQTTTANIGNTIIATPILSPLYPTEKRTLSLAWTIYDPRNLAFPFMAVNTAPDGASLVAAFASFGGPSLNLVYADEHHIGYHTLGRIPIRGQAVHHPRADLQVPLPQGATPADEEEVNGGPRASLQAPRQRAYLLPAAFVRPEHKKIARPEKPAPAPKKLTPEPKAEEIPAPPPMIDYTIGSPISSLPVDALQADQQWSGYIPYNELPSIVDPPSGVLSTANARIVPDDYPYAVSNDWADPYRAERIYKLLGNRTGLTPPDMLAMQNDVHSDFELVMAQRLAYAIDHASTSVVGANAKRLHQAADLLRAWHGELTPDSAAAAIVTSTRAELWPLLLTAHIRTHDGCSEKQAATLAQLYTWNERNTALELLLQHTPRRWLPRGYGNWNDFLAATVVQGLQHGNAPSDLTHWSYGAVHPVEIAHPVFASHSPLSRLLGVATGTGLHPAGGDSTTPKAIGLHFGPSERFTADLSNSEATASNITTGQSGNPASAWYLDQFLPWLNGTTLPLPLEHPDAAHTLTLLP